jgi:hypothetical protein
MIELGHESPTLYMLAGLNKPTNYSEVTNYIKATIKELGLELKNGDEAVLSYASYYIHQIAKGKSIRNNLTELYKFSQMRNYEGLIYDFYLLYWAWDDLDYEDTENNHYWNGANRENIEQIVVTQAKKWIDNNRNHFMQKCLK